MKAWDIEVRYINYACYEIRLPSGRTLITDPSIIVDDALHENNINDIQLSEIRNSFIGADYLVISHTHNDHISEAGYFANKYNSKVFVGANSARALAKYSNINLRQIYACENNSIYMMEDFVLKAIRSRHSMQKSEKNIEMIYSESNDATFLDTRIDGSLEYVDYCLTLKNNIRIYICGGYSVENYFCDSYNSIKDFSPDIMFCQVSRKMSPYEYAKSLANVGASIIFPLHQDGLKIETIGKTYNEWSKEISNELNKISKSVFIPINKNEKRIINMTIGD